MPSVVVPDILRDLAELSVALCVGLFAIGFLLYILGGYGHRFWLVLGTTLAAGIVGLQYGQQFGMQPLVAGLFVGVSAGALALALMRIAIFVAVGTLVWYVASQVAPGWNEQLACFLVGGLAGVMLFRVWVMVLTSVIGTVLMTYATLLLVGRFGGADVAGLAERNGPLFTWAVVGVALLGLIFQTLLLRGFWSGGIEKEEKKEKKVKKEKKEKPVVVDPDDKEEGGRGWFTLPFFGRKAG